MNIRVSILMLGFCQYVRTVTLRVKDSRVTLWVNLKDCKSESFRKDGISVGFEVDLGSGSDNNYFYGRKTGGTSHISSFTFSFL